MKETLTIGEISKLFQINVQTLLYYDKIGLLVPRWRNPENGYRRYRFDQIYCLASIRYLRKLGYSLEQIRAYLESRDIHYTLNLLKEQSEALRKKAEELTRIDMALRRKIQFVEDELPKIDVNRIWIQEYEERRFLIIGSEEFLYREEAFYLNPTVVFYEGDKKYFGVQSVHDMEDFQRPGQTDEFPHVSVIPKGRFLCGYHQGAYERMSDSKERIQKQASGLNLADMFVDFNIIDQFVESNIDQYITELQIPIIENEEQQARYSMKVF